VKNAVLISQDCEIFIKLIGIRRRLYATGRCTAEKMSELVNTETGIICFRV
jgi:hypothetical protein